MPNYTKFSYLRKPEVLKLTGISKSTLYARITNKEFPPSINLGGRAVAWIDYEILSIMKAYASGQSIDEIKILIKDMLKARQQLKQTIH